MHVSSSRHECLLWMGRKCACCEWEGNVYQQTYKYCNPVKNSQPLPFIHSVPPPPHHKYLKGNKCSCVFEIKYMPPFSFKVFARVTEFLLFLLFYYKPSCIFYIGLAKIRTKLWWLQKGAQTIEKIKLYGVQLEDDTIQNPTECEEMEHCRFFNSKMLCEVMRSLTDTHIYAENKKNDAEADISKYISFCIITLTTAILLTEGVFDHYVNNCILKKFR